MITLDEYARRRQALAKKLSAGGVAFIPAANEVFRNADSTYRFRQDSSFFYLTGFNEPNALLMIRANGESVLFNRPRSPSEEQWTGKRLGQEAVAETLGIAQAYSVRDVESRLPELIADTSAIYYPIGCYPHWERTIFDAWAKLKAQARRGTGMPHAFFDVAPLIAEMRLHKSDAEMQIMRQVAGFSVVAHQRAMQLCKQLNYEYELEAEISYELLRQGCRALAYDSIVASGKNACILHYTDNNQSLKKDALVLIDAGGELYNYAADITRTFPASGQFSPEQKLIYELVLSAQKQGMHKIKPGNFWNEVQDTIVEVLTAGLVDLGILKGSVSGLIEQQAYKPFYMHQSGHWLGLDVHDAGAYKIDGSWRPFVPGMVLTVEPGLYISESKTVEPRWWNIGVRIEDDVLVALAGFENLTAALAVEIDDIEACLRA